MGRTPTFFRVISTFPDFSGVSASCDLERCHNNDYQKNPRIFLHHLFSIPSRITPRGRVPNSVNRNVSPSQCYDVPKRFELDRGGGYRSSQFKSSRSRRWLWLRRVWTLYRPCRRLADSEI